MTNKHRFAWPLVASAALVTVPALAQDAEWDRDQHFSGVYVQGAGGIGLLGENGSTFEFDTNRDGNYNENVNTVAGANAFSTGFCNGGANGRDRAAGCRKDKAGAEYAARIGYDSRMGNIVAGGLIEVSRDDAKERATAFSTTPAAYRIDRRLDYAVSARARVGYTPGGGALFYGTGGVSYGKIKHDFTTTNAANSFDENNDGDMVWGWQAGGGTEIMVTNNVSLGLEYLYTDIQDDDFVVNVGPGTAAATNPFLQNGPGTDIKRSDDHFRTHSVRASLNFRF